MKNILIMLSGDGRTDIILKDIGRALSLYNFSVSYEDAHLKPEGYADDFQMFDVLTEHIYAVSPDFVLMSGVDGILSSERISGQSHLLEMLQIPFISINFQSPIRSLYRRIDIAQSSLAGVAINERRYIDNLKSFGFRHVFYFPGAADNSRSVKESSASSALFSEDGDCLFVGNLLNRSRLTWGRFDLAVHFMPLVLQELSVSDAPLNKLILHHIEALVEQGEITRADFSPDIQAALYDYAANEYNFLHRKKLLLSLSQYRVRAVGDGWEQVREPNIQGIHTADYERDIPALYRRTPVTVGISSCESITAAPLDVFSCFAAGGFMLSDYKEDLAHFFSEGEEIEYYRTSGELKEKIDFYLEHPRKREEISKRARDKILQEHTWERRVIKLIEEMDRISGEMSHTPRYHTGRSANTGTGVTAALVVKNEEPLLERCLASLEGSVDEIIVLDTGSGDRTPSIARNAGALVYFSEWKHDFSAARNRSIQKAGEKWILIINADERLKEPDIPLKDQLNSLPEEADAAAVSLCTDTGRFRTDVRILRNREGVCFSGRVNEWACVRNGALVEELPLELICTRIPGTLKGNAMIRISIAQGPYTLHMLYSLVVNLDPAGDTGDVIRFGEECVELIDDLKNIPREYMDVFSILCEAYLNRGDTEKALDTAYRVLNVYAENPDMWWVSGMAYYRLEQYEKAFLSYRRFMHIPGSGTHRKAAHFSGLYRSIRRNNPEFGSYRDSLPGISVSVCMLFLDNFTGIREILKDVGRYADEVIIGNATGIAGRNVPVVPDSTVRLINLEWQNSFADACNALIRLARKDWVLFLNPDESMARTSIPLFRDTVSFAALHNSSGAFTVICDEYAEGRISKRSVNSRLIRAAAGIRFQGNAVCAVPGSGELPCLNIVINEKGRDRNPDRDKHCTAVKLAILDSADDEEKGSADFFYQLVTAQAEKEEWASVVLNGPRALLRVTQQGGGRDSESCHLSSLLIKGLIEQECYEEAEKYATGLTERFPGFLDGFYFLIIAYVKQETYTAHLTRALHSYRVIRERLLKGAYAETVPLYGLFRSGDIDILKGGLAILKGREGARMIQKGLASTGGAVPEFVSGFLKGNLRKIMDDSAAEEVFFQYQDSPDCLLLLIERDSLKGDTRSKFEHLNRLAAAAPFYRGDAEYYKAELFLKQGNRDMALQHYVEAIPQYQALISSGTAIPSEMLMRYAVSLERTGRITTALSIYEFLLKVCSRSQEYAIRSKINQLKQFLGG